MEKRTETIPVELADGTIIRVEVTSLGEEEVAFEMRPFREVTKAIEGIAGEITESLNKIKPDKATIEFEVEMAIASGQLTAVIAQGSGRANLKVTLEWGK